MACYQEESVVSEEFLQNLADLLGTEWRKVGTFLGISNPGLQALRSDNSDNLSETAFQMLLKWREDAGLSATHSNLSHALRKASLNRLADHVSSGNLPSNLPVLQTVSSTTIVDRLKKDLGWFYKNKLCKVPISPWEAEKIPIESIFTNVELLLNNPDPQVHQLQVPLESHHKLFSGERESQQGTRSILRGKAGSGKSTTVARLAYDWMLGDLESPLSRYDILFVLKMRYMLPDQSFVDAILSQLLPRDGQYHREEIERFVLKSEEKIAIIFDGYDEYSDEGDVKNAHISEILSGKRLRHCCVLITMRPWKALESKDLSDCTVYEVKGFSSENVDHYILKKSFKKDSDAGEKLISYLEVNNLKESIASIPLLTSLLCHLWKRDPKLLAEPPSNLGQLFECLCTCFDAAEEVNVACSSTEEDEMEDRDEVGDIIEALGETALDGLFRDQQELTFTMTVLREKIGKDILQKGKMTGLLIFEEKVVFQSSTKRKGARSRKKREKYVSFYHKIIQEYCAGIHLAKTKETDNVKFREYLKTLNRVGKVLDLAYVLLFACWKSQDAAREILAALAEIMERELRTGGYYDGTTELTECHKMQKFFVLCLQINFEAQSCGALNSSLSRIFREGAIRLVGISSYTSEALAYYLKHISKEQDTLGTLELLTLSVETTSTMREMSRLFPSAEWLHTNYMQVYARKENHELEKLRQDCAPKRKESVAGMDHWYNYEYISKFHLVQILEDWQCHQTNIQPVVSTLSSLRLTKLHLTGQNLSPSIHCLIAAVESKCLANLRSLNLSHCNLSRAESDMLAEAFRSLNKLEDLNLTSNVLGPPFANTLSTLTCISSLFLEKTLSTPKESENFAMALRKLDKLIFLEYRRNPISEEGASILSESLTHLKYLENFRFSLQTLPPTVISGIIASLGKLKYLKNLQLLHTPWPNELCSYLADVVPGWKQLEDLRISGERVEELGRFPDVRLPEAMKVVRGTCGLENFKMFSMLQVCIELQLLEEMINSFSKCRSSKFNVLRITKRLIVPQDGVHRYSDTEFLRLW